eukprot:CFRG8526T1
MPPPQGDPYIQFEGLSKRKDLLKNPIYSCHAVGLFSASILFLSPQNKDSCLGRVYDCHECLSFDRYTQSWMRPVFNHNGHIDGGGGEIYLHLHKVKKNSPNLAHIDNTCIYVLLLALSYDGSTAHFNFERHNHVLRVVATFPHDLGSIKPTPLSSTPATEFTSYPIALYATGTHPLQLISSSMRVLEKWMGSFRTRAYKEPSVLIGGLGWCTWEAYRRDISHEIISSAVSLFKQRSGSAPRFVIIDDGWQDTQSNKLVSCDVDRSKLPFGLTRLTSVLKDGLGVSYVGVWHTMFGYWDGIHPHSSFAYQYAPMSESKDEEGKTLYRPRTSQAETFFQEYHKYLTKAGIHFTKVDDNSSTPRFVSGNESAVAVASAFVHALQSTDMPIILHCMCHNLQVIYSLFTSNLIRTSDDYYPNIDECHGLHIMYNSFNTMWLGILATPDWDMFYTNHTMGRYHAISRLLSGGLVYICDRPEHADYELIDQMCCNIRPCPKATQFTYGTGTGDSVDPLCVMSFLQPCSVLLSRLFVDPSTSTTNVLFLTNHIGPVWSVGVFHCNYNYRGSITDRFTFNEIQVQEWKDEGLIERTKWCECCNCKNKAERVCVADSVSVQLCGFDDTHTGRTMRPAEAVSGFKSADKHDRDDVRKSTNETAHKCENVVIYSNETRRMCVLQKDQEFTFTLQHECADLLTCSPVTYGLAPIGLFGKLNMAWVIMGHSISEIAKYPFKSRY